MKKLAANHHPRAYVRVKLAGHIYTYTVHVARLKTAIHGAWRRFPNADEVEVSRERSIHWSSVCTPAEKSSTL